jgi:excisionase family DNA binding protein
MARRSYFTTFEISRICQVNPTTVQNWIKEKKLQAFVTPGGHRRVRLEDLIAFMKQYGMPIPPELDDRRRLVLIVDDDEDILELLTTALQADDGGLEVVQARDGVEALLLIGERKPDLLILDILLPGMNGIEVCQKLRSGPGTRGIKIAAVTGDPSPDTRKRVLEAGADLFFAKPFDMADFIAGCHELLGS